MLVRCVEPQVILHRIGDPVFQAGTMTINYQDDLGRRYQRIRKAMDVIWFLDNESLKETVNGNG